MHTHGVVLVLFRGIDIYYIQVGTSPMYEIQKKGGRRNGIQGCKRRIQV